METLKIFSFDAETNGLWGQAFSIAAFCNTYENGVLIESNSFIGRCPISEPVNDWVAENVIPQMEGIDCNYNDYESLLKGFVDFYMANKQDATILVHMGLPVEARLFLDAHDMGLIGDFDAPFPLVDCSAIPEIGTSADSYCEKHNISVNPSEMEGGTHNPKFDSLQALNAYKHWLENK